MDLKQFGLPLVAIYLLSDVGSVGGGWLSSAHAEARHEPQRRAQDPPCSSARCFALPSSSPRRRLERVGGRADHRPRHRRAPGLLVPISTLCRATCFPRSAVGTVIGIGGALGGVGGMLFSNYRRPRTRTPRRLSDDFRRRRPDLSGRAAGRPPHHAEIRAGEDLSGPFGFARGNQWHGTNCHCAGLSTTCQPINP